MTSFGKILAGICSIFFVLSGVTAITLFNIERKAFSAETYKLAFDNQNLYERMPAVLAVALSTSGSGDALLGILATEGNIASFLPPQELKAVTDDVLDSTFAYLNGETDSATASLLSLKSYLAGEGGTRMVTQLLSEQPNCTIEQITQITLGLLSGGNLLLCNPPEELMGLVTPFIESQLQAMMNALPNEITIISGARSNTPADPRIRLDRVRAVMKLTLVIPLFLLPAIVVFAVRSIKELLKWWGLPILFTGGFSLIVALLGSPVVEFVINRMMKAQTSDFIPPVLLAVMSEAVGEITKQILKPVGIEGVVLFVGGLGMLITATVITKKEKPHV
ncbi:MAG TPA: hypothetical protein DCX53_08225 [Anaerolineae bacterium]|nr:hypothetical protein [Anaerolineae bacterium]